MRHQFEFLFDKCIYEAILGGECFYCFKTHVVLRLGWHSLLHSTLIRSGFGASRAGNVFLFN